MTLSALTAATLAPREGRLAWRSGWLRPGLSVWALWSQLAALNGLSKHEAQCLACRGVHSSIFATPASAPWLRLLPDLNEEGAREATSLAQWLPSRVIETHILRYCVQCLREGYHAACFQHRAITRCPRHDVPLLAACEKCDTPISADYESARRVPYGCSACGRAFSFTAVQPRDIRAEDVRSVRATAQSLCFGRPEEGGWRRRETAVTAADEAADFAWWAGPDPFVSRYRAPTVVSLLGNDDADAINATAWSTYRGFLVSVCGVQLQAALALARVILFRQSHDRRLTRAAPLTAACGALIARYGGERAFEGAQRLLTIQAPADRFELFPQQTQLVERSAAGNAEVLLCELRSALLALFKLSLRQGAVALIGAAAERADLPRWTIVELDEPMLLIRGADQADFEKAVRRFARLGASSVAS